MPFARATCSSRPLLQKWSGYGNTRYAATVRISVKVVQEKLNSIQGADLDVDGYFGSQTTAEVRTFQRNRGLVVDGIVGSNTWRALCSTTVDETTKTCPEKQIKITKFCVDGTRADGGDEVEVKFSLDGHHYFPRRRSDCTQTEYGYCDVSENGCLHLDRARWLDDSVEHYQALTVSINENDAWDNDDYFATISDWHDDTCEPYELRVATDYRTKRTKKRCVGFSAGVSYKKMGEIGATFDSCSSWEDPAESFIWYIAVEPLDE